MAKVSLAILILSYCDLPSPSSSPKITSGFVTNNGTCIDGVTIVDHYFSVTSGVCDVWGSSSQQ